MPVVFRWFLIFASVEAFFGPRWTSFASREAGPRDPRFPKTKDNGLLLLREQCPSPVSADDVFDHDRPRSVFDWTPESSPGQLIWKQSGCIEIPQDLTLCLGAGYSRMHLPNLLEHETLEQVNENSMSLVPLIDNRCHPDIQIFLCSLFAPICHVRPIWPCRKLCRSVQASCEPLMLRSGSPWPQMLRCDKLPSDNLCIGNQKEKSFKGEKRCSVCDQSDTLEGIVDHFCRVDTALRLNVDHLSSSALNVKIIGSKLKVLKHRKTITKETLLTIPITVDSGVKCSCYPLWNRSTILGPLSNETQYLVMGVTRNDHLQVSFLKPFNVRSQALIRAMSAIRKDNNICTTGIKRLLQQSTKTKKKSKKKENKQKAKIKKKEIKQKLKARKEIVNATTKPQNKKKPNAADNNGNQTNNQQIINQ